MQVFTMPFTVKFTYHLPTWRKHIPAFMERLADQAWFTQSAWGTSNLPEAIEKDS